ncbi:MAG: hypothetical protein GKR97_20865 [Rhizobiaceae bacterium]|nr:hypothetical protein [Rhizobiaceae bacterium]
MHSAPFVAWAGFDGENFEVTSGFLRQFHSSPHAVREFCGRCASTLTYRKISLGVEELKQAARLVYISVASLDNPSAFPPDEVVHGKEMIDWFNLDSPIPVRDFISSTAGHLQFGGLDADAAKTLARDRFGDDNPEQ